MLVVLESCWKLLFILTQPLANSVYRQFEGGTNPGSIQCQYFPLSLFCKAHMQRSVTITSLHWDHTIIIQIQHPSWVLFFPLLMSGWMFPGVFHITADNGRTASLKIVCTQRFDQTCLTQKLPSVSGISQWTLLDLGTVSFLNFFWTFVTPRLTSHYKTSKPVISWRVRTVCRGLQKRRIKSEGIPLACIRHQDQ